MREGAGDRQMESGNSPPGMTSFSNNAAGKSLRADT